MKAPRVDRPQRRGRLVLLLLAGLFLSGIVLAYALIKNDWYPTRTKNYGELVVPARPIADVVLQTGDGRPAYFSEFRGKWTFVYFGPASCLTPCTENLYKMRQIAAAQGKESFRIQRAFIVTDGNALELLRYTLKDFPGTALRLASPEALKKLTEQFALSVGTPEDGLHRIYLVDPLGNLMMSYPLDADPKKMSKDLALLLRASQIG